MPEESSNRVLISNIQTTFTTMYPNGTSVGAPVVRFKFSISPKMGITDFLGQIGIKSFKYCLIQKNENNEYREPNDSDTWIEFSKDRINSFIVPPSGQTPIFGIAWGTQTNVNNKVYLSGQKNASSTSEPVLTTNYITFDIKKFCELNFVISWEIFWGGLADCLRAGLAHNSLAIRHLGIHAIIR